jgi:predicted enzyme related to lactoylglutathione lyase
MGQPVVHFEITGKDPTQLRQFFGELFGWTYEMTPNGLVVAHFSDPEGNLIGLAGG